MELLTTENKGERLCFAYKNVNRDWSKVIFSGMSVVRCVNVWVTINEYGPCGFKMTDYCQKPINEYVKILNDIVLPYVIRNENTIFVQVRKHKLYQLIHPYRKIIDRFNNFPCIDRRFFFNYLNKEVSKNYVFSQLKSIFCYFRKRLKLLSPRYVHRGSQNTPRSKPLRGPQNVRTFIRCHMFGKR